ncbi:MAG TPA: hypothetical protein VFI53_04885 [Myxococcaceae bacterium]|nr:hypothetical protein [Myxococcaceae bacterium]
MRRGVLVGCAVLVAACGQGSTADRGQQQEGLEVSNRNEPPMGGIHWARGQAPAAKPTKSPNLIYHGGPVMTSGAYVEPIFWGTRWNDASFVADKISGMQLFYSTVGGSSYEATDTEYTDASGAHVGTSVTLGPTHVDLSTAASNGNRTSVILAEACAQATTLVENGYYPVYVDTPRGHAGFCAWHSAGTCPNGTTIQFGFFFNLDGDPGCDPEDASGLHSQGTAALGNVSGHELSETLTDQHLDAWYDASGAENSDKCAWAFGTDLLTFKKPSSQWKVQGNWSNAAFNAGTGYPNRSGQNGCIDGGNFL